MHAIVDLSIKILSVRIGINNGSESGRDLSFTFPKVGKECPNFGEKCLDYGHLWVTFLI